MYTIKPMMLLLINKKIVTVIGGHLIQSVLTFPLYITMDYCFLVIYPKIVGNVK